MTLPSTLQSVSGFRVLHIQKAVSEGKLPDSVLCVAGIDGNFNIGCKNFSNFIFPELDSLLQSLAVAEEVQDDFVVCIKASAVEVYCNSYNIEVLAQYFSGWNGLKVHCHDEKKLEEEGGEDFKVKTFISMFSDCSQVGIPYTFGCRTCFQVDKTKFDPMSLERWPLVQAYAYEEFGGHGFFTLSHEVCDVTNVLEEVLYVADPVYLQELLKKNVFHMEKAWGLLREEVNQHCMDDTLTNLSEKKIVGPLLDYYRHVGTSSQNGDEPFVLIGVRTNEYGLSSAGRKSGSTTVLSKEGSLNRHMVLSFTDATSPIKCIRTYFFDDVRDNDEKQSSEPRCERNIQLLYSSLVDLVETILYNKDLYSDYKKAKGMVLQALKDSEIAGISIPKADGVVLKIDHYDFLKKATTAKSGSITNVELTVRNIKLANRSQPISISFGESFIVSEIKVIGSNGQQDSMHRRHLNLTSSIPRFGSWEVNHPIHKTRLNIALDSVLGSHLSTLQDVLAVLGTWPSFQTHKVSISVYAEGIIINGLQGSPLLLTRGHIKGIKVHGNDSSNALSLLLVEIDDKTTCMLPPWLLHKNDVTFTVLPNSLAYHELYRKTLSSLSFSSQEGIKSEVLKGVPSHLRKIYSSLQRAFSKQQLVSQEGLLSVWNEIRFRRFLEHFQFATFCEKAIPVEDLTDMIENEDFTHSDDELVQDEALSSKKDKSTSYSMNTDSTEENTEKITLTIISGPPDCPENGPDILCRALVELNNGSDGWMEMRVPESIHQEFSVKGMQNRLVSLLENENRSEVKHKRLILLLSGYVSIREVIHGLQTLPDNLFKSRFQIGTVICCFSPAIFGRSLLPILFEQCIKGFVTNVVLLVEKGSTKSDHTQMVTKLIKRCNKNVNVVTTPNCKLIRSGDIDLMLSNDLFNKPDFARERYLSLPISSLTRAAILTKISVTFGQPLDKEKLIMNLRGSVLYMEGEILFFGNENRCLVKWNGRKLHISNENVISDASAEKNVFFATFFGFQLTLEKVIALIIDSKIQPVSMFAEKDITDEQYALIKEKYKTDALPEGWFYSGTQYLCLDGQKSFEHPLLQEHIRTFISAKNESITAHNKSISCFKNESVVPFSASSF